MPSSASRLLAAVALVVGLAVVPACSSSSKKAETSRPTDAGDAGEVKATTAPTVEGPKQLDVANLDACTILTQEDAETLIGRKLTEPLKAATSDVSSCTYPGDPNGPTAQVAIFVGSGVEKQLQIDKDQLQHPFTSVSGLGDESWQEDDMIFTRSGNDWVSVQLVSLDDPKLYVDPLQSAMKVALGRLADR